MNKLARCLVIGSLALFPAFCFGAAEHMVVFAQDFENSMCGTIPKRLTDDWQLKNPTNEMCRYVTNIDAATGEKSLIFDFSQLSPSSSKGHFRRGVWHGWLSWYGKASLTNGWIHWTISVKRLSGLMQGEIRSDIGSRTNPKSKRLCWIAYWLSFGEEFAVRCEAHKAQWNVIGPLPKGRWCKIDLELPLPGNTSTNAWGRVSVKNPEGIFVPGFRVAIPLEDMKLLNGYSLMQIGGYGTAK